MKKNVAFSKLSPALITILVVLFVGVSCNSPKKESKEMFDMTSAKKAIEEQNAVFIEAMNKGDSVTVANNYTIDAKFMQPNAKAAEGRNNIQHLMSNFMKSGMPVFDIKIVELWGNDETLTVEEQWTFSDKDGKIVDSGKALELWKMEDGKWKIHRDCYNSDMPMTMPMNMPKSH
ncbi:nuclear transport factor 2 family protein [Flavobacterium sp. K5-23]|uniref:YybH family protein n=1 Tax=Flavobacterium sp. K5-23 TaxID=2746225 RepID=UPI00200D88DC|nr:nuclear transport factor 2 family protein [Flavobacterium sp. K5-23]UQD57498.1 nuclear transport factor 2 family protein [Flavobacterium sp. K5-23]